jgi:uncharacterized protein (TIGR00661 family)
MKIFYAVQATGNGHISRAMEILPHLEQYGEVDLFLSGANSTLPLEAPVKYRSKGVCFFYNSSGSLHYLQTIRKFAPLRIFKEAKDLPVEKYDLIINDFECITSIACAMKKIHSVNFGHQASFMSKKVPRPKHKSLIGEFVLQHYARASQYIGLHFKRYDDFILPPVIKKNILAADPMDKGYISVYLPSYSDKVVSSYLSSIRDFQFEVFSKELKQPVTQDNISFIPVDKDAFNKRQVCNATALQEMGVKKINSLDEKFSTLFASWIDSKNNIDFKPEYSPESIVGFLMQRCKRKHESPLEIPYPGILFN